MRRWGEFLGVLVKKADGSVQSFDREKVVRTCLRMGANRQVANEVAERVERRLYNGISTAKILRWFSSSCADISPGLAIFLI